MQSFEVKYETAPRIPPPYCYYYQLKGREEAAGLRVEFQWVYHQREGMTPDELEDEGFTGQDDYHWNGLLDIIWLRKFTELVAASRINSKPDEEGAYLHITVAGTGRVLFEGSPNNDAAWEYFLQELIQAIYETSGKEAPLTLRFKRVSPDGTASLSTLTLQFRNRQIQLNRQPKSGGQTGTILDWDQTREVLQAIYLLEYHAEDATEKDPEQPGNYIDVGEGVWYELGRSAKNPAPRKDYTGQIQRFFEDNS